MNRWSQYSPLSKRASSFGAEINIVHCRHKKNFLYLSVDDCRNPVEEDQEITLFCHHQRRKGRQSYVTDKSALSPQQNQPCNFISLRHPIFYVRRVSAFSFNSWYQYVDEILQKRKTFACALSSIVVNSFMWVIERKTSMNTEDIHIFYARSEIRL